MTVWKKIAILIVVQVSVLVAMIGDKQWTLNTGTPVILLTEPVDPRSLFMGDYARLSYGISSLDLDGPVAVSGDKDFKRRDTVWVGLQRDPTGAKAVSAHHHRDGVAPGLIAVKGEVDYVAESRWDPQTQSLQKRGTIHVRYGIEHFFVPEGTGNRLERPTQGERISVRAAIDKRGKAGILAVLTDGREIYKETLF